jgi:hypothetical protein
VDEIGWALEDGWSEEDQHEMARLIDAGVRVEDVAETFGCTSR